MHPEVMEFFGVVKDRCPELFSGKRVLEVGCYDVNGSIRPLFEDCDYVGLDWRDGPGVDVVSLAHEYAPLEPFDVIVSSEALEHDGFWERTLVAEVALLRVGGSLLLTWAAPGRGEHELHCSPLDGYYRNLSANQVRDVVVGAASFEDVEVEEISGSAGNDAHALFLRKKE